MSTVAWCLILARWSGYGREHAHARTFAIWDWALMVFAMMMPLVFGHIRFTATRSLWRRRQRAILEFVCGYASVWLLVGVAVSASLSVVGVTHLLNGRWMPAAAFGAASIWQLAPWRRRALAACHRTMPLAPRGWRADRDCLRYGGAIGTRCVMTCGVLMLGCVFAGHGMLAMLTATAIVGAEGYYVRADERSTSAVLGFVAVAYALLRPY